MIALGAVIASLGAYAFQVVGGRALGDEGFAPVAIVWTIGFLVYTIVMLPVEQMTTRRVTLAGGRSAGAGGPPPDRAHPHSSAESTGVAIAAVGTSRFFAGRSVFVIAMALLMFARAIMTVARGVMAGRRRFRAYGVSMMLEAFALTGLGILFAVVDAGSFWFGLALGAAPLTLLLVRPYLVRTDPARAPR
jgi:O-antigen/teichoic acid export membrane protein